MFQTTRWTMVLQAAKEHSAHARPALSAIAEKYWKPLYHIARHQGLSPEDAEDATQSFIAAWLDGPLLENVDPAKGKFRTYLLVAWKRFLVDRFRTENRMKRGGHLQRDSLENRERFSEAESDWTKISTYGPDPHYVFAASWATSLVDRSVQVLKEEYLASGRQEAFQFLLPCLTQTLNQFDYSQLAQQLRSTPGAAKVAVHRFRKRLAEIVRQVVLETLEDPAELEEEMDTLFKTLLIQSAMETTQSWNASGKE